MSSGKLYSISVICINHGLGNDSLWLKQPLSKTFLIVRVISGPFSSSFSQVAFFFPRPVVRRLSSIGRKGIDSLSVSILDILFSFKSLNVTYGHDNVHVGSPCLTERSPRIGITGVTVITSRLDLESVSDMEEKKNELFLWQQTLDRL